LYPNTSAAGGKRHTRSFIQPLTPSLTKKKKQGGGGRPRTIIAVMLEKELFSTPKGPARERLLKAGRIKQVRIHREMDYRKVQSVIKKAFSSVKKFKFMMSSLMEKKL